MTRYIQNPDGKFAGSIGKGRDTIPVSTATPVTQFDSTNNGAITPDLAAVLRDVNPETAPAPRSGGVNADRYVVKSWTPVDEDYCLGDDGYTYQVTILTGPTQDQETGEMLPDEQNSWKFQIRRTSTDIVGDNTFNVPVDTGEFLGDEASSHMWDVLESRTDKLGISPYFI